MEDFIEYILWFLLIFFIVFTGLLLFLLITNPTAGYLLIAGFFTGILGIGGIIIWKFFQKKHLGAYYDDLQEILQLKKEIYLSTKHLEKSLRKAITEQLPQVHQLCHETQRYLRKVAEIDKVIAEFEKKHHERPPQYQDTLRSLTLSRNELLRQVHQVQHVLQELHAQILAMRYAQQTPELHTELVMRINDMLHAMRYFRDLP